MKYHFFARLSRMKYINRWGLMRNTIKENIAEHSLDVGILAHALAVISNTYFKGSIDENKIAVLAMYHDAPEIITGDLPTPIKYFAPEIRDAYQKVEDVAIDDLLASMPEEMQKSYQSILRLQEGDKQLWKFVKAADKMSAYIKCLEEKNMGNKDFMKAEKTLLKALHELNMPEVEYFLEKFVPAYSLTVDEQKSR